MLTITKHHRGAAATAALTATLLATVLGAAHPAEASASHAKSIPTGATSSKVDPHVRATIDHRMGKKAISFLGTDLAKHAKRSHISSAQLKKLLTDDHSVRVDEAGNLEASDGAGGTGAIVTTGKADTLVWPINQTQLLHSRPGATKKIYLDFNGHTTTGTQWNTDVGRTSFTTPVWSRDGDLSTFNTAEAAAIQAAYSSVAEDFAPFDVDVTTQDPGVEGLRKSSASDTSYGIRVVVGKNTWLNVLNSGFAKFYSFSWNNDTPAYCFADANTPTKQIAECISHETGHTVGLFHDGQAGVTDYYKGHANWAPIMGDSYSRAMTQWSRGQYPGANNTQDDLSVIGSYLGWVPDDYAGTTATTATLPAGTTRSGKISYGSGEYDAFKFSLGSTRTVNIQSWEGFQQVDTNLNSRVQVTNSAGTVIATSSPSGNTRTNMNVTLAAGTYYVFVDGVGENTASTGYTNYDSMGYYNLLLQFV
ncbi:MAG: repeat-containing protein [Nocardioidaceae bacterium]|nr:repeat-containing protein [Nocardioidaceae bacterium]